MKKVRFKDVVIGQQLYEYDELTDRVRYRKDGNTIAYNFDADVTDKFRPDKWVLIDD